MDGPNSAVIVAIPSEDDYVWKISSEEIPHMTLLYLNADELDTRSVDYIGHVINTSMVEFGLHVDRRGLLGPKDADVLFFGERNMERLLELRSYFLKDLSIFRAFHSIQQYPSWTSHLTLGYPETPARSDTREYPGIPYVNFDKIALWTGDYEGPEFKLKRPVYFDGIGVSMSDLDVSLAHFGVKGMKWGVRRAAKRARIQETISDDARNAGNAYRKAKKVGLHSISNKELQDIVTRMNLEQQYSRLKPSSGGKKALSVLKSIFATAKTVNEAVTFVNSPTGKLIKQTITKATKR